MPCVKRRGRHTRVWRMEQSAMKNGFKPGVHEKQGLYIGHWVNDMKQGKGKKIYKNKTVYEGDWMANKRHGCGVLLKKVDDHFVFVYEGQWINNRFAKGKWYEKNGVYDGSFATTAAATSIKCGYGIMRWNDGVVYQGHWHNNQYDGLGRLVEVNGNFYEGSWSKGLKHGEGVYVFKDKGQLMEGIWVNGTPKVSIIRDMDAEYDADMMANDYIHLTRQYRIPEISKSDEMDIRKAYEQMKLEILKNL